MAALPMSLPVYSILAKLVEDHAGIHYGPDSAVLLAEKLSGPAQEAGFDSLLDYYYYLRYDPGGSVALDALIEALVVHETYFFREAAALQSLVDWLIAPAVRDGRRPRVWSAACSTGEEPLTLAMILDQAGLCGKVDLVASDISDRALDRGRRGESRPRSLRALPQGVLGRWITVAGDRVTVRPDLCAAIDWRRVNLADPAAVTAQGTFDAILCRNVLIYFQDATACAVIGSLTGALVPGGRLMVGVSESLMRFGTQLRCEEHQGAFFYARVPA